MFSSISLFCYLNQSWAAGWIHSHCDVFAPPPSWQALKASQHFIAASLVYSSPKTTPKPNPKTKPNQTTKPKTRKLPTATQTKKGPTSRRRASLMAKPFESKSTRLAHQRKQKLVNAELAIKSLPMQNSSDIMSEIGPQLAARPLPMNGNMSMHHPDLCGNSCLIEIGAPSGTKLTLVALCQRITRLDIGSVYSISFKDVREL